MAHDLLSIATPQPRHHFWHPVSSALHCPLLLIRLISWYSSSSSTLASLPSFFPPIQGTMVPWTGPVSFWPWASTSMLLEISVLVNTFMNSLEFLATLTLISRFAKNHTWLQGYKNRSVWYVTTHIYRSNQVV